MSWGGGKKGCTGKCVQRGSKINVQGVCAEVIYHVLGGKGCAGKCVQRGSKMNVLGGYGAEVYTMSWGGGGGGEGLYREVCPEGVQNKCPGGVWCRGKRPCPGGKRVVQGSVSRGGPK